MNPIHETDYPAESTTRRRDERDPDYRAHSRSPAQLERDIERTRNRIEARARQLEECLAPSRLLDQAVARIRGGGGREFFSNLGRDVRDNPLPLVLTGVGIAWLMQSDARRRRDWPYGERSRMYGEFDYMDPDRYGDDGDHGSVTEKLQHGVERAREGAHQVKERIREGAHQVGEGAHHMKERAREMGSNLGSAAREGRERVREVSHSVGDGVDRLVHGWNRMLDEQPVLLGLVGLAVGAAIAAALPSTETEDEWLGDASDELKERAARKGHEYASEARRFAEEKVSADGDRHSRGNGGGSRQYSSGVGQGSSSKPAGGGASGPGAYGSQATPPGGNPSGPSSGYSSGGSSSSGGGSEPGASSPGTRGRASEPQQRPGTAGGSPFFGESPGAEPRR